MNRNLSSLASLCGEIINHEKAAAEAKKAAAKEAEEEETVEATATADKTSSMIRPKKIIISLSVFQFIPILKYLAEAITLYGAISTIIIPMGPIDGFLALYGENIATDKFRNGVNQNNLNELNWGTVICTSDIILSLESFKATIKPISRSKFEYLIAFYSLLAAIVKETSFEVNFHEKVFEVLRGMIRPESSDINYFHDVVNSFSRDDQPMRMQLLKILTIIINNEDLLRLFQSNYFTTKKMLVVNCITLIMMADLGIPLSARNGWSVGGGAITELKWIRIVIYTLWGGARPSKKNTKILSSLGKRSLEENSEENGEENPLKSVK